METESIEIKTSKEKFFMEYLILKKPVIDAILSKINGQKTSLSEKPLKVFAQFLYYNDQLKNLPDDDRWSLLFSKEYKDKISESLSMKEHHINIYISQLRKLRIFNGKKINKPFIVYANDRTLNIKFSLNGS
jgi:hypothetical protein